MVKATNTSIILIGDKLNPSLWNLEWCTNSDNHNHKFRLKDLPTGVSRARKKFNAKIQLNGENVHIGNYDTPDEASMAYKNVLKFMGIEEAKYVR